MATLFETPAEPDMHIKALAAWFGGKRNLAPTIVKEIGPHRAYWEPFCGSMAVLLAKPQCSMETVNDLHGDLINLARVLKDESLAVQLYDRLSRFVFHEDLFHELIDLWRLHSPESPEAPCLDRATRFMVCSWFGRNGVSGTKSYNGGFCARYTKNGGHAATRFLSAIESIPAWHQRLRAVTILNRDAFSLLERIEDAEGVAGYCDPPYIVKGASYKHDFAGADHQRLATALNRFRKTRWVVSYYEHPDIDSLYQDWRKIRLHATKALCNQGMRDKGEAVVAPEILLCNW